MNSILFFRLFQSLLVVSSVIFVEGLPCRADATVTINKDEQSVLVVTVTGVTKIQPWSSGTIRVEQAPGKTIPDKTSFAVIAVPVATGWTATEAADKVTLKGTRLSAEVNKLTGLVSFFTADGSPLLAQTALSFDPAKNPTRDNLQPGATFARAAGEHYFGGGVIGDNFRQASTEINLQNDYLQMHIPILYSARGYAFFWDNPSRTHLKMTADALGWLSSAGDLVDFYVMAGPSADETIAEYRDLTGSAPIFPKWAYGFWFSKNKFNSQQEILTAAKDFRTNQIPVDLLIQDYFYWKPDHSAIDSAGWGSHHFVPERYPDPKGMIDQLHNDDHIHFMAVIWPRLDDETDHAKELDAARMLFPHADTKGWNASTRFYDPFTPKGREIYGRQVMESLLPIGLDAFWMDGAEPEMNMDTFASFDSPVGPVSRVMDAFPLMHTTAVYEAQRAATQDKRVVLLPRSSWAGEQRNAACAWTSDINQDWKTLAWQIEGLQNYSIMGLPYVTTDGGGYNPTPESDRELFVRWFEWASFCPIFRVHGIARPFPWEYGDEGKTILQKFDELHYRLLPYLYTQAAGVHFQSGTLMRPLVMDFRDDAKAIDTWDEFLYGPSILVCPVYHSLRQSVGKADQWADLDGKSGGVTVTYLNQGTESGSRADIKQVMNIINQGVPSGFQLKQAPVGDQAKAKSLRIEGTFTPDEDGSYGFELNEHNPENFPVTVAIDGKSVSPTQLHGMWQFPLFPFAAQKGVAIHLVIETKNIRPGFRIIRMATGPLHRDVYLPGKGDWYDFWTGQRTTGSQTVSPETPLDRIPLYVRAGSILPMGPELQYAAEKPADPIELRVYRGADGAFSLYEDEGDNYNYEKGAFATIPMTWSDATQTLTIGERKGSFSGMLAKRTFEIVWVGSGHGTGEDVTAKGDSEIFYDGQAVTVKAPAP